jgi:hypothetical protein
MRRYAVPMLSSSGARTSGCSLKSVSMDRLAWSRTSRAVASRPKFTNGLAAAKMSSMKPETVSALRFSCVASSRAACVAARWMDMAINPPTTSMTIVVLAATARRLRLTKRLE